MEVTFGLEQKKWVMSGSGKMENLGVFIRLGILVNLIAAILITAYKCIRATATGMMEDVQAGFHLCAK